MNHAVAPIAGPRGVGVGVGGEVEVGGEVGVGGEVEVREDRWRLGLV